MRSQVSTRGRAMAGAPAAKAGLAAGLIAGWLVSGRPMAIALLATAIAAANGYAKAYSP